MTSKMPSIIANSFMTFYRLSSAVILGLLLCSTGLAGAFGIPETLRYDISWAGIKAGESVIEIKQADESTLIAVTTKSANWVSVFYPVNDRVESRVTPGAVPGTIGSPLTYRLKLSEGRHRKDKEVIFDKVRSKALYIDHLADERKEFDLPGAVFDPLSSFYQIRSMQLEVGKSAYIKIFDSKKVYDAEVQVLRKERIEGPEGEVDTLVIKPIMKSEGIFYQKGEILIWISDDDKKIPLRMKSKVKIGSVTATLTGGEY
ncbi:MAG: DUF3108 domain-containing protein [Thermodesulfovibrio sp.]|nr:DUF3108 domain-containing protein [Thermodesulfovibrio sp.]